jgi:hypothetical protein
MSNGNLHFKGKLLFEDLYSPITQHGFNHIAIQKVVYNYQQDVVIT